MQSVLTEHFAVSPLSAVRAKFAADQTLSVTEGVSLAVDGVDTVLKDLRVLSHYVQMTLPKMEDGNNFGVTVQLSALKQMSEASESLQKQVDELFKYASARADALEKCKLPGKSVVSTQTEGGEDGPKTETKTSSTTTEAPELTWRNQAVTQVDVMYYSKAKAAMETALSLYLFALDYMDKNAEKIAAPKGDSASGPAYSSMY